MTRGVAMLLIGWCVGGAAAQTDAIPWRTEPQQAVAEAQRTLRPLMVYVLASNKDRDNNIEREQKRALADPRVLRQAQNFIPLRLSRSVHRDVLKDFGLPESANMQVSFVAPDGQVLGDLSAGGVGQPDSLAAKMAAAFDVYRKKLYDERVKPALTATDAKPADINTALRMALEFRMASAEADVIALLDQPRLDATGRSTVLDLLAALSSDTAVDKLIALTRAGDARAAAALEKCTPAAAERIFAQLNAETEPFEYPLYKAVTKICGIRNVKAARYFEKAKPRLKEQELERVGKLVEQAVQRWKEENDAAR